MITDGKIPELVYESYMSPEEALDVLINTPVEIKISNASSKVDYYRYAKARLIAMKSIERCIPKEPEFDLINGAVFLRCPSCGSPLMNFSMNHCRHCLQLIDWRCYEP